MSSINNLINKKRNILEVDEEDLPILPNNKRRNTLEVDKDPVILPSIVDVVQKERQNTFISLNELPVSNLEGTFTDEEMVAIVNNFVTKYLKDKNTLSINISQIDNSTRNKVKISCVAPPAKNNDIIIKDEPDIKDDIIVIDDDYESPSYSPRIQNTKDYRNTEEYNNKYKFAHNPITISDDGSLTYTSDKRCSYLSKRQLDIINNNREEFDKLYKKVVKYQKNNSRLTGYSKDPHLGRVNCNPNQKTLNSISPIKTISHLFKKHFIKQSKNLRSSRLADIEEALIALSTKDSVKSLIESLDVK